MRRLLVVLLSLAAVPAFAAAARPSTPRVEYTFRVGPSRVSAEMRFAGDASGKTQLILPSAWAGEEKLYACVGNLRVLTPGAELSDTDDPAVKAIAHAPNADLRVSYDLVQDVEGAPHAGRGAGYRPVVQPTYFQWIGNTGLVVPGWDQRAPVDVRMAWRDLPNGWTVANSFGARATSQRVRARLEDVLQAVYAGGDFRVTTTKVRGKTVAVAMRGAWTFSDADFATLVGRIVGAERAFWRDDDQPYFLVTVLSLDRTEGQKSVGGTGLTDSFATFMTTNATTDDVTYLLAHEYFHNWNSTKLGRPAEPEARIYWFSEGFTDYYAYLLLLRDGLLTREQYVARVNEVLRGYYTSPARSAKSERIEREFFTDEAVSKQPYWRGALLAASWDARIRRATNGAKSLDDVMRDMLAEGKKDRDRELSAETIDAHVRRYLGESVLDDVRRYVDAGETIEPSADLLGPDVVRETTELPVYELGLDLDAVKRKEVASVVPGSAAYAAGLRDGQTIVRRKPIYLNDPTHEVEITIKDGDGERTIVYLPRAARGTVVPQFRLTPPSADAPRAAAASARSAR